MFSVVYWNQPVCLLVRVSVRLCVCPFVCLSVYKMIVSVKALGVLTLSQTSLAFYVSAVQVFWKYWEKEKLFVTNNFSFSRCFLTLWISFSHVYQISNCRLQSLSVWKSLKFVVWERVKSCFVTALLSSYLWLPIWAVPRPRRLLLKLIGKVQDTEETVLFLTQKTKF